MGSLSAWMTAGLLAAQTGPWIAEGVRAVQAQLEREGTSVQSTRIQPVKGDLVHSVPMIQDAVLLGALLPDGDFRTFIYRDGLRKGDLLGFRPVPELARLPLSREAYDAFQPELRRFFLAAADVLAGPERFVPFLSTEVLRPWREAFARGEELRESPPSDQEMLRWVAQWLDQPALEAWRRLAGVEIAEPPPPQNEADYHGVAGFFDAVRAATLDAVRKRELDEAWLRRETPYLRALLQEGLLERVRFAGTENPRLPERELYRVKLGRYMDLLLAQRPEGWRVVAMLLDD